MNIENIINTFYNFYGEDLYYFSIKSVIEIIENANNIFKNSIIDDKCYDNFKYLLSINPLNMNENTLLKNIDSSDSENVIPYIVTYYWKQKYGLIDSNKRLYPKFDKSSNDFGAGEIFAIRRLMVLNDYSNIYLEEYHNYVDIGIMNHLDEVEMYLGFHKKDGYIDDDYFSLLLSDLAMFGTKNIKKYDKYNEIIDFIEYIIKNINKDERISQILLKPFLQVLHDIEYNTKLSRECFKKILNYNSYVSTIEMILAIQHFGEEIYDTLNELYNYSFYNGFENFCRLINLK
ncbi:MAG: hypothetical protein ABF289_00790 [Clostridiales bacterium]